MTDRNKPAPDMRDELEAIEAEIKRQEKLADEKRAEIVPFEW